MPKSGVESNDHVFTAPGNAAPSFTFVGLYRGTGTNRFARDVQPLFNSIASPATVLSSRWRTCASDRRRDAMRGGTIAVIAPGTSSGSRLYHKITGTRNGARCPRPDHSNAENIEIIKRWRLDQGAQWPDELAGERTGTSARTPSAERMMEALRLGEQWQPGRC